MKRSLYLFVATLGILSFAACGGEPSAAEQEKAMREVLRLEAATQSVDSSKNEVAKTSQELDSLLNELNAASNNP
jgi:hypothetical protein